MSENRWADLARRSSAGVVMVLLGLVAVWFGGLLFHALVALVCLVMVWELVTMMDKRPERSSLVLAAVTGVSVMGAVYLPVGLGLPLLLLPSLAGLGRMERGGVVYAVFTAMIMLAGYGIIALRDDVGLLWMFWLALVVIATDVLGYFAGRMIGGPKFWPRVSPSKTWAGTIAGWVGAALVGLAFSGLPGAGFGLIGVSVAASMASQIGDIAESAIKRRAGVKDSSSLIPGHGGMMDRFDGMLGAAVFLVIAAQMTGVPPSGF